jgi:hypothetical protein
LVPADIIIARLFVYLELRLGLSTLAAAAPTDDLSKNRQSDLFWRDGAKIETCRRLDPLERCGRHTIGQERLAQGRHRGDDGEIAVLAGSHDRESPRLRSSKPAPPGLRACQPNLLADFG